MKKQKRFVSPAAARASATPLGGNKGQSQGSRQSQPSFPRHSSRLIKKQNKNSSHEVINLLDDSDDSEEEEADSSQEITGAGNFKQQLANTVQANIHKPKMNFGELEKFPLKEVYFGEERFAFVAPHVSQKCKRGGGAGVGDS